MRFRVACEEMNFIWTSEEVKYFRLMWKEGKSINQIGIVLDRDADEVLILAIDQSKSGFIKQRQGGALGVMA